ncbi:PAS domain S-box-containing protein [Pseudomonas duriflava]|uniref:histidine kinase n=1 Tax=Pseudomonas duriflava TaxID=459528 RepID=A0A562QG59_9PSED|nr:PAS domain S-box protein [Pseudomonas duriflava]TWI55735.1 PAS domain S-box-containing protein [Pseudomonas duriflava]
MISTKHTLASLSPEALAALVLQNTADYAVVVADLSGTIVAWNQSAEKVLGWSAEEAIGQHVSLFFTPEDCANGRPETEMREAAECGCATDERWHIKCDGTRFWASGEMTSLRRAGELLGYTKILRDRTRERLTKERLRLAQQVGNIGTFEVYPEQDKVTISREMCQLWGLPEQDSFSLTFLLERIHPKDRPHVAASYTDYQKDTLDLLEYRIQRADTGEERWMAHCGEAIHLSVRGESHCFLGMCYDITERKQAQQARMESDARLLGLTEDMQEAFYIAEPCWNAQGEMVDFRFLQVNPAFNKLTGTSREEAIGRSIHDISPEAAHDLVQRYARLMENGRSVHFEIQMHDSDDHWFESWARKLSDNRFAVLFMDITSRKQTEAALAESEARFKAIANSIEQIVWATHPDGRHYYFNDRWYEFTGVPASSAEGEAWINLFHPDDRARIKRIWQHSLTTGEPYHIEYRLRYRSGQYRWMLGRAQAVRNLAGDIESWFGTCTDIQDIVDAREILSRSREELERLIEVRTRERDRIWRLSNDLMKVCHLDGQLAAVNAAWSRTLGWTEQELAGRSYFDLVHPDEIEHLIRGFKNLCRTRQTCSYEVRLRHADGSYRLTSWTSVPEDNLMYSVGRDITEQRQLEEQLRQSQKMEAIGQLTGGIAHDFNNLLTGIIGSLDLMQRRFSSGRTQDIERYMTSAVTSAQRAAALTQRLLAFSRRQALDLKPVNVNTLVASMEELLRRTIGEKIELTTALGAGIWPALTDNNQLESALLNLVINARDAMPNGGSLRIETGVMHVDPQAASLIDEAEPGDYVVLSVSDTGTGMTPEVMARAFDPFFTTKPIGQGTGLGLSMIYGYAKQSKGHVQIHSTLGQGTSVHLYLPRFSGSLDEVTVGQVNPEAPLGAGEVVLVVEDEAVVRALILEVLSELGYATLEAADAHAALPLLESSQRIDLMISDVGLPGMNGRQLADVARQSRPRLKILLATGYAEGANVSGYLDPGMELINKPFNIDTLANRIKEMISAPAYIATRQTVDS